MLAFSSLLGNVEGQNIYRIWYDKPASYWEEALPVGNGRIAAMVFGDPQLEQIQLNEETVPLTDCFIAPCQEGCPIHQDITR